MSREPRPGASDDLVLASFALNSTGLGHASRLVAIHDAVRRRHGLSSLFFTEHRIGLIDEYGFEQVVLPPYAGSLLGDVWWNRDEGTPSTVARAAELARTILSAVLAGRRGMVLHDVVVHEQLYLLARARKFRQALVYRPRSDVADPPAWLAERAPGVANMYLIGERESVRRNGVRAHAVPNVRREPRGDRSVWTGEQTGVRVAVSAGGGGHDDAESFVHTAVEAVARFADTASDPVSAFVVPGPFYGGDVVLPRNIDATVALRYYLPPEFALHRGTDVQVCQGGYNTIQELAASGAKAVVVPGRRMIDDQAARARELAARAPNLRVSGGDPAAIAAYLTELLAMPAVPARPSTSDNGADAIADDIAGILAGEAPEGTETHDDANYVGLS